MLRDGQFIKEPRIEIGSHYVPYEKPKITSDDIFMQDILSNNGYSGMSPDSAKNPKIIDWIIIVCVIWFCLVIFVPLFKILFEYLIA
jgi:hypothetical protein